MTTPHLDRHNPLNKTAAVPPVPYHNENLLKIEAVVDNNPCTKCKSEITKMVLWTLSFRWNLISILANVKFYSWKEGAKGIKTAFSFSLIFKELTSAYQGNADIGNELTIFLLNLSHKIDQGFIFDQNIQSPVKSFWGIDYDFTVIDMDLKIISRVSAARQCWRNSNIRLNHGIVAIMLFYPLSK